MELRVGNKYRLGRKIGSGSFGDIYLGEYSMTSQRVMGWDEREGCERCGGVGKGAQRLT